jgi:hypothetical protein
MKTKWELEKQNKEEDEEKETAGFTLEVVSLDAVR